MQPLDTHTSNVYYMHHRHGVIPYGNVIYDGDKTFLLCGSKIGDVIHLTNKAKLIMCDAISKFMGNE